MKLNNKIVIPVIVILGIMICIGVTTRIKNSNVEEIAYSVNKLSAEDLIKMPGESEDKGVIRKYKSSSSNNFGITYINEQGKVQVVNVKDLYVIGDVEKFEGANFTKKVLSKDSLTSDQIYMICNTLGENEASVKSLVESIKQGTKITIGFVSEIESEEK